MLSPVKKNFLFKNIPWASEIKGAVCQRSNLQCSRLVPSGATKEIRLRWNLANDGVLGVSAISLAHLASTAFPLTLSSCRRRAVASSEAKLLITSMLPGRRHGLQLAPFCDCGDSHRSAMRLDGSLFASPLFRLHLALSLTYSIIVHVATPCSRENPLSECNRLCDNLSCTAHH